MPIQPIEKSINVAVDQQKAFEKFVHHIGEWWPSAYTWSQDKLQHFAIDPRTDGLCSEWGPYGFRCDWGRVTGFEPYDKIEFTWQISAGREPVPNPEMASLVEVHFKIYSDSQAKVNLRHHQFANHGDDAGSYRDALDSSQGWDFILDLYKKYCKVS